MYLPLENIALSEGFMLFVLVYKNVSTTFMVLKYIWWKKPFLHTYIVIKR